MLGQPGRDVGRKAAHGREHDGAGVGEVEHERVTAVEEDMMALQRSGPHERAERAGADDGLDCALQQRARGEQVGRATLQHADDDLACHDLTDGRILQRGNCAVGERVTVADLGFHIEGEDRGHGRQRREQRQDHGDEIPAGPLHGWHPTALP